MDYTYSLIIDNKTLISSTTLSKGISYFFLTGQFLDCDEIMLLNNDTGEVVLDYNIASPGDILISSAIKEI